MLIFIHNSVVDNGDENTWDDDTVLALENLATARREGKHSVTAKRETLEKIVQCSRLSEITRKTYKKLYGPATQYLSYLSVVTKYIEIVNRCYCYEPKVFKDAGKQIIKVPPSFFNDSYSLQETILLCENSADAFLYESIGKVYLKWNQLKVPIAYEPRGGGGNTIANEYINIQQGKKRFCLCIVDSDKIAPYENFGSTASRIQDQSDSTCLYTRILVLDCREIENLIPPSILSNLCSGNQERHKETYRDRLEALKVFESISGSAVEAKYFLDIKKGTWMKEIINAKHPKSKEFWQVQISLIPNISSRIDDWCLVNWKCSNSGECKCKISLGFGENTLSHTLKYLQQKTPNEIEKIVEKSKHPHWENIGEVVMNWCIADSPIRTL
ncbi:hypothetical protein PN499_25160 [Kamptonema animale CS-326]|jgi:hypothetical protein|uniref:hypothetical protein n=1 Tax=Kamptonema animale TaxID=92934 RepID=UPI0023300597|nr:hypothetical protein [Kamptonema animale]MDB9514495.1 hypothetical protein [Kamptonema animale CS-326]